MKKEFIDSYTAPTLQSISTEKPKSRGDVAKVIMEATDGVTIATIIETTKLTVNPVRRALFYLRTRNLIHASGRVATKDGGLATVYAEGPDVNDKPGKKARPKILEDSEETKKLIAHTKELAKALVPKRSFKEQCAVNRQYWNWISNGVYG